MQPWFEFYAVIGAAAAALMGLLFVAVSMNARSTLGAGHDSSRRLTEQAFQNYLAVLMVSLVALFPDIRIPTFGRVALAVTAIWVVLVLVRLYQALRLPTEHESRFVALRRLFSSLVGFGILTVAAVRMAMNYDDDRDWFASGAIVLLFSATEVSWGMLNRIARSQP